MPELHSVPLPVMIGASNIGDPTKPLSRVVGPPSQKYPILRDLAASPAQITIELDTEGRRYTGVLKTITEGSEPHITVETQRPSATSTNWRPQRTNVALKKIIAFRVLKVEVAELPAVV